MRLTTCQSEENAQQWILRRISGPKETLMNDTEFRTLVMKMRDAQKTYFKTRDHGVLKQSKDLEQKVDHELAKVERPGFFDD